MALGTPAKLKPAVSLSDAAQITGSRNNPEEEKKGSDYHVATLDQEDAPMTAVTAQNLRLLPSDASLENIESRVTSVSLGGPSGKKGVVAQPGASLTNVLKQAL